MKILHLISSEGFYGAENVVAGLAHDLQQIGHEIHVGLFQNNHVVPNTVAANFQSRGLSVTAIQCRGRFDASAVRALRALIQRGGIDLLHSHGYKSDIYAWLAARNLPVPLIATSHLWTRQTAAVRFYEFLDARILRKFDAVVAVSDRIAAELRSAGISKKNIYVFDNGIDLAPFNSAVPVLRSELQPPGLLIGTVGRLVEQKGISFFLQAACSLLKEFPALQFVIVGDGPDRQQLQQQAGDLKIEDRVFFAGARNDMPGIYASLDIFVLSSISEGLPIALLEAMASRVPVVSTDVGAISRVIVRDKSGILVRPRDPDKLSQAISCLVRDPELRKGFASEAYQRVATGFSSQVMTQNYCRLYEELLPGREGGLSAVAAAEETA